LLADVLEQSLTVVREKAVQHSLRLETEIAPDIVTMGPIVADQRKIKQVLYNLLSNAVKFTPDGGSVVLSAACDGTSHVVLRVRDTGIGIPPEDQERIFDAFEQVDTSYTRQKQGTGLGLALTRRLVSLHGGDIRVDSVVGEGSTFSVRLPQDASGQEASEAGAPVSARFPSLA
jgi:signal transduction histidine kinase